MYKSTKLRVVTGPGLELLKRDVARDKIHVALGLPVTHTAIEYKRLFLMGQIYVAIYPKKPNHVYVLFMEEDGSYVAWLLDKNNMEVTTSQYKNIERCICWCSEN